MVYIQYGVLFVFPIAQLCKLQIRNQICQSSNATNWFPCTFFSVSPTTELLCLAFHLFSLPLPPETFPLTTPCPHPSSPHPWGETLLVDKFSSSVTQCSLTHFSAPLMLFVYLYPSLPWGLLYRRMQGFRLYTKTVTPYWHHFANFNMAFHLVTADNS